MRIINLEIIIISILFVLLLSCCEKEKPDPHSESTKITISNTEASNVSHNTATLNGTLGDTYGQTVSDYGHCWSTDQNPDIADNKTSFGETKVGKSITSDIGNLEPETYYYRAYFLLKNSAPIYSEEKAFTTLELSEVPPAVSTATISNIIVNSAQGGGNVTSDGGASVTAMGVCWSTLSTPTITDSHTSDGSGTGSFVSSITGLTTNTTYYVRAYATNSAGIAYGNQIEFTTESYQLEYISGNNQTYGGGSLPYPMVFKIMKSLTSDYVTDDLSLSNLSLTANASVGYQDGVFNDLNDFCGDGAEGCYGGYYYVPPLGTGKPYTLIITVELRLNGELIDSYEIHQNITNIVTDIDGNVYQAAQIGNQVWMAENLKVTRYADGSAIQYVTSTAEWDALTSNDEAYCWYENSTTNRDIYGGLYTWPAAMNGASSSDGNPSGVQGVCPDGWHLPSDSEWMELESFLGLDSDELDLFNEERGAEEGSQLKSTSGWYSDGNGDNSTGFTALPGGLRGSDGSFVYVEEVASFWTATSSIERGLFYSSTGIWRGGAVHQWGKSIRCIKD